MISAEEQSKLAEFLAPPRIAVVATIGRDDMPQLTPNWYVARMDVLRGEDRVIVSVEPDGVVFRA